MRPSTAPAPMQRRLAALSRIGATRVYSRMVVENREGERRSKHGVGAASAHSSLFTLAELRPYARHIVSNVFQGRVAGRVPAWRSNPTGLSEDRVRQFGGIR